MKEEGSKMRTNFVIEDKKKTHCGIEETENI
jgi:hypothetical protein